MKNFSPLCYVIEPTGRFRNEMEKESGRAERMLRRRQNNKNPAFFPRSALKAAKPSDSRPLSRGSKSQLF